MADTGIGIAPEAQGRLFEPFFTTKGEKGTGLGLWVSRDIISKHEGSIRVRSSQKGKCRGTCFSLFFPAEGAASERRANAGANSSKA